jgi:hypothetical protein
MTSTTGTGRAVLLIVLGGALVAAAVGIGGEFPLNDDASYAWTTKTLCDTGTFRFLPWTAPSLVFQAGYGAVLCRLFGFSFALLRLSTVVLAIAGVVAFFFLLRRAGARGAMLGLATAVFALNPVYVNLAFTFMTEVPFTTLVLAAAYAFVRGLDERRAAALLVGAVGASAALLVRQQGILVAVAAAAAVLSARSWSWTERRRGVLCCLLLPALAFVGFHLWIVEVVGVPAGYGTRLGMMRDVSLASLVNCGFRGLCYLGLFALPVGAVLAAPALRAQRRMVLGAGLGLALMAIALFARERAAMFYLTNVLYDFGVGALTLRDTQFLGMPPPVRLGAALTLPLTLATLGGGALLVAAWTSVAWRERAPVAVFLHVAGALFFGATLLQSRYYLDRHVLTAVPFVLAALAAGYPRAIVSRTAVLLVVLLGWYGVAGTHDYLAWNRARFAGLAKLGAEGVPPAAIDGGVEFNAWHIAPTLGTWPSDAEARSGRPDTVKSWWWVIDDRFIASFHPLPRYAVRDRVPYGRWLAPGTGEVLVLERED